MFNDPTRLVLDIKCQDILRKWFATRGSSNNVQVKCVALGDSDIDYEMSGQVSRIRILNSPYAVPRIKHKILYQGNDSNLSGSISLFSRHIDDNGVVGSLYTYPPSLTYTPGQVPPTLGNGYDQTTILFSSVLEEGFIVYFQTLPIGYVDVNGIQERFIEPYSITVDNLPVGWEYVFDDTNGSVLIAKPAGALVGMTDGLITITGLSTGITRSIGFNY